MSTDGFILSADGKTLTKCDFAKLGTVINVPSGITKIANAVFAEAPVTKVILPDSVTEIGQNLFSSCETLEDVKLPSNLTSLKPFTFAGCSSLRRITMPDNVTSFPEGLFWGCASLSEIPFRNGMEALETDVCRDCESITSLLIPPSVKTIKTGALAGCTNLSTIIFPAGLESIQDRSLAGLKSLQYMRFSGDCEKFFVDENGGCLYQLTDDGAVLIKCPVNTESVRLVEITCDVHVDAFEGCSSLTEVYASEDAPETLINKLMELVPSIDINSYGDEPTEEEEFSEKIKDLGDDLDKVQVNADEFSAIGEFTQNDSDEDDETDSSVQDILNQNNISSEEVDSEGEIAINQNELESILNQHNVVEPEPEAEQPSETEMSEDERIQEILNSQVCRDDSLDDGFRPVTMDELEKLMNGPVVDPMELINSSSESTASDSVSSDEARIQEILNSQVCRDDSLDDGFRPVTMDELERLMNGPVVDPMELINSQPDSASVEEKPKRKRASRKTKKTDETSTTENSTEEKPKRRRTKKAAEEGETATTEEKPKRKRGPRKSKQTEEEVTAPAAEPVISSVSDEQTSEPVTSVPAEEPSVESIEPAQVQSSESNEEPRFIRAMKNLASHQMVVEDEANRIENVYGDLKELLVIADGVAPSTNDFSSHLVKFTKAVAKKYGFTKIYFFEDLPLDNPEFIYGLESFGNFRNVLYACNKPSADNITEDQKGLINAAGITLPASSRIQSVKEKLSDVELQYPVKILVQDNYIEGLLYCAEKYRKEHDIK